MIAADKLMGLSDDALQRAHRLARATWLCTLAVGQWRAMQKQMEPGTSEPVRDLGYWEKKAQGAVERLAAIQAEIEEAGDLPLYILNAPSV